MAELPYSSESEEEQLFRTLYTKGLIDVIGLQHPAIQARTESRYLQARVRVNDHALENRFRGFMEQTGIEVTAEAQNLTKTILNGVLSDPHPRWEATPEERVEIVNNYIQNLPETLTTLAKDENVEGSITTFDLLHWLSTDKHLARICIIQGGC
jgi:hypothetical protein